MAGTTKGVAPRTTAQYWAAMSDAINSFPPDFRETWFNGHWKEIRGRSLDELAPEGQVWKNLLGAFKRGRWKPRKKFTLQVVEGISPDFMRMVFRVVAADLIFKYMALLRDRHPEMSTEDLVDTAVGRVKHLEADLAAEIRNRMEETVSGVSASRDPDHPEYINKVATARPPDWVDDPGPPPTSGLELYHFTCSERLETILKPEAGLLKGDVPITPHGGYNAPWLTTDPSWTQQSWADGSPLDKTGVRITVRVPEDHLQLHHWSDICETHGVDPGWRKALTHPPEGGKLMDDTAWYVFHGRIPPTWFIKVEEKPQEEPAEPEWGKWGIGRSWPARNKHTT